jgi:NOL1/NOP2/sun family putative RNA methylase
MKTTFQDYFRELIGEEEAEQFFTAVQEKKYDRILRVNTLKTSKKELSEWLESQGYQLSDSPFSSDALVVEGSGQELALKLPYHVGWTYPQDAASMFAVEVLDPQPGERIIDLTAAPGGKTTHIAQRMQNTGVLIANDMDSRRLKALHSNLERLGVFNTIVTRTTAYKLAQFYGEFFDRILLDPSCSGEGLLVTHDGKPGFWNKKSLKKYAAEQFGMLCSAFMLLKPGGRLVYSTCTLNDVEDDGVVEKLLQKFPEAKIEKVEVPGTPPQIGDLKGIRFWPHKTGTKGFFCIAITKTESLGIHEGPERPETPHLMRENQLRSFVSFLRKEFGMQLPTQSVISRDSHLFFVSDDFRSFPMPPAYSLAFPAAKAFSEGFRLTHPGAIYFGLHTETGILDLDFEQTKTAFAKEPIQNDTALPEGNFIGKYKKFPLGNTKATDSNIQVVIPQQH